jgi:hypothetical protein
MKTDHVWFQSTYKYKDDDIMVRTIGYAYNPAFTERIILYVPIGTNPNPYYREEKDFLNTFEYVGC